MELKKQIATPVQALLPRVLGGYAVAGGALTLIGWFAQRPRLTDWDGDGIAMFVNTALMAIGCGAALMMQGSAKKGTVAASRILALLAALVGAATLFQHLSGIDLGIDQLLVRASWGHRAAVSLGRPGPPASLSFTILGVAITLLSFSGSARRIVPAMGILIMSIASFSLMGYAFGADPLYAVSRYTGIAMESAMIIFALAVRVTASVREHQPMRALMDSGAAGALVRRSLPCIVGIPIVLGWLRLRGQRAGLFDLNMGTALLVIALIALLCTLLWWCAGIVSERENILRAKEAALTQEVAERQRTERELSLAAHEAKEASRAKDDFLAALSHELRTPLSPALINAADLENDPSLPDHVREKLTVIRRNIQLEARLIDDLLDVTRISSGKLQVHPVLTDVHELLRHAQETLAQEIRDKRIEVRMELEALETCVHADPARLLQVLWNLLKNAVKFTPQGGSITLSTFNPAPRSLAVRVRDSGIGIPEGELENIFLAFHQGALTGRHQFGGLGLGLSISRNIMEAHGGSLMAESAGPGHGAAFTMIVETTTRPASAPAATPRHNTQLSPLRLLLVEDHVESLEAMSRLLERDGHSVFCATNMREALSQAKAHKCDLVISDIGLPDGDGYALMSQFKESFGWPGIALSGYGMEADHRKSRTAGFSAHLVKPVDLGQLRDAIASVVNGQV